MQIRRNTKAFKTILEIVTACQSRADREKLIRLYITKVGHSIADRISIEGIEGDTGVFYDMSYQTVLNYLASPGHQLYQSDEVPGIYFFRGANKAWDELPFEFDEAIKKEFASLPELPAVRKKEKPQKFVLPAPKVTAEPRPAKKEPVVAKKKAAKAQDEGPRLPNYKLKHKIAFTALEKVMFRQAKLSKKDVLDYYNDMAEYILPYLKDRPQLIRLHSELGRSPEYTDAEGLKQVVDELPDWLQTAPATEGKERKRLLLCNDREHLLFYIETGCLQFNPGHSRTRTLQSPDYIVIGIDPPESAFDKAIEVALATNEILTGLQLPSFVKTDGFAGLHLYIPLDSKSTFETGRNAGEYICKLIRLKIPDLVALAGSEDYGYGKVSLDYLLNDEGKSVVAPYSLVPGQQAHVATPLLWEEVQEGLRADDFNHASILKRLKEVGDPFANLFKKKASADALFEKLEANYAFLF